MSFVIIQYSLCAVHLFVLSFLIRLISGRVSSNKALASSRQHAVHTRRLHIYFLLEIRLPTTSFRYDLDRTCATEIEKTKFFIIFEPKNAKLNLFQLGISQGLFYLFGVISQIPSGSEFLLNSTGSFKRFESIDRDYKPIEQTSLTSPWNTGAQDIPPQPLRPAPLSPTLKGKEHAVDNSTSKQQLPRQHSEL